MKKILLLALLCLFIASTNAYAWFFESTGWVDPNYNNSWDKVSSGIARYSFYIDTPGVNVNFVALDFEGDIFDLNVLDTTDFKVAAPPGWFMIGSRDTTDTSGEVYRWVLSGGLPIDYTQDPIIIDVAYTLLDANRYYYGDNVFAGDSNLWAWNEAQGANLPWSQKYALLGEDALGPALSPGSTGSVVPEPTSMMLLGMGILGLFGLKRKT